MPTTTVDLRARDVLRTLFDADKALEMEAGGLMANITCQTMTWHYTYKFRHDLDVTAEAIKTATTLKLNVDAALEEEEQESKPLNALFVKCDNCQKM